MSRDNLAKLETDRRADAASEDTPTTVRPTAVANSALFVLVGLAIVLALKYLAAVFIPIVLALLISYALEPVVAFAVRRHVPRALAAALLLLTLALGGGWYLYGLRDQATAMIDKLPEAALRLRRVLERERPPTATAIQQVQTAANELEKAAAAAAAPPSVPAGVSRVQIERPAFNVREYLVWGSMGVAAAVVQLVLIFFLVFFVLASGDLYRRKLVKIVGPSLSQKKITVEILQEIDRQIESFLLVQIFSSIVVGVATWLAFTWLGVEQAALWGLVAAVFNSIPYIGPIVVTGGTSIVGFLQFGTLGMTLIVAATSLVITSLEGFLLTPWLTSRAARMNAVAIFIGLIFWGSVWQVWGMLLAVPMMMVIKAICDHVEDLKGIGELLGD
jgi:predicted PurR-regulated permease PerM